MTVLTAISSVGQAAEAFRTSRTSAPAAGGADFASMLGQAARGALDTMHRAEQVTANGLAGTADTQSVVQTLSSAELTMQTVVAVRDKVLGAYNEVMRMNI